MKSTSTLRILALTASIAIAIAAYLAHPLLRSRPDIPKPAITINEPKEFRLTRQFSIRNDRDVLATVLKELCVQGDDHLLLSDEPNERADNRKKLGLDEFPAGITCGSIKVEPSAKLSASISTCPESARVQTRSLSWPCFSYHYPQASGILRLSLPFYYYDKGLVASVESGTTCGQLCGGGQEYLLRKTNGKWKIVERKATWIA